MLKTWSVVSWVDRIQAKFRFQYYFFLIYLYNNAFLSLLVTKNSKI